MGMQNYGGAEATKREAYKLRLESKISEHKTEDPFWATGKANIILVPIFSIMDGMVLFSIFDACFTQSAVMGIVMAFGVAVVLNVLPLIIAKFVHQAIYRTKRYALQIAVIFIFVFFLLFAGTVILRFAYSDMYGEEQQSLQLENMVSNESAGTVKEESANSGKRLAVVLLLSLNPLITSVIGFAISYVSDDEVRKKVEFLEKRDVELDEAISDLEAAIETMNNDAQRDVELDEEMMGSAVEEIIARCDILKALARFYLAEYLADPSATSKLSQEMRLGSNDDAAEANGETSDTGINIYGKAENTEKEIGYVA